MDLAGKRFKHKVFGVGVKNILLTYRSVLRSVLHIWILQ